MAFISPEDLVQKKALFYADHFLHEVVNEYLQASALHITKLINTKFRKSVEDQIEKMKKSKHENTRLLAEELQEVRRNLQLDEDAMVNEACHDHRMELDDLMAKFEDYKIRKANELEAIFSAANQYRCNTRGVKFCGAFPFPEAAAERAQFLAENVENGVHHFVAQSFNWLPFDPNPDAIKDNRYQNKDLNELMRRKQENSEFQKRVFEDDKQRRIEAAKKQQHELKKALKNKYKK